MRVVVAVHDPPVWSIPPAEVDRIAHALPDLEVIDARDRAARRDRFPAADILLITHLTAEEFTRAVRVRWMHSTAVGVGGLLPPPVLDSPVIVTNSRGTHAEPIAEHAIALALAVRRRLHTARARQAERRWAQEEISRDRVPVLSASTLLVLGLGAIGSRIAALGAGLGMRVEGIRRRMDQPTPASVSRVRPMRELRDALRDADVVIIALPETADTSTIIGEGELQAMRPGAVLVNVARGGLIDDEALVRALSSGRIGGAGLDAFTREPLPADSPYWTLPNVIVSPHTAAFAGDYWTPAVDLFLENVARFRRGEPLLNVVDKRQGY